MKYWWATQGHNYEIAIEQKTLWTCPRAEGAALRDSRSIIFELQPGDIVFHHTKGHLEAVSEVRTSWRDFLRPYGYERKPGEGDEGWLVTVEPIKKDLHLHYTRVVQLIKAERPGPFNSPKSVYQGYLSRLSEADGVALLKELEITPPLPDNGLFGRPADSWDLGETDSWAWAKIRQEQTQLRSHLLDGRSVAQCSLCGFNFPSRLLIAGHIKPRSKCTEKERGDFRAVAMLVCNLGCDALFEWGYVVVDSSGRITAGRPQETEALSTAVDSLIDRQCWAHNKHTAANFAEHRRLQLRLDSQHHAGAELP